MTRSILSKKCTLHDWQLYEKQFREKYKAENGEPFKGNILQYITVGVIQRKKLPDFEDVVTIARLERAGETDEELYAVIKEALVEEYKERGLTGIFCDYCKDLCIDIPLHPTITSQINGLEDAITKREDALNQINKMIEEMGNLKDKLIRTKENAEKTLKEEDKLGVDNKDTQEDK